MQEQTSSNSLGERVPKLRFPEFEGGWICEKLSDFTERVTRKNTDNETSLSLTISSKDGLIDQISYFNKVIAGKDMSSYYLLKHGEYAYNRSYSVGYNFGSIKRLERYSMGALSTLYICFSLKKHNSDFIKVYFDSLKWYHEIHMIAAEGARNHGLLNVSTEDFFETEHWFPINIDEQEKIAKFFKLLEYKIKIQQRLLENLKLYKRGLLSKLFPQKDENVPQYRFEGFIDAWEQRKALELAEYSKGNGYSKRDLTEAGTPIILYGRLYTKYQFSIDEVDTFAVPQSGSVYSQGNEVIVPASGETAEDIARASAVEKPGILLGGDLNILRPFDFINPLFLALAISSGEPQKELAKKAQGKSVVHIHNSDIQEVTISYPLRAEQDRIVAVFHHIDHLITLHQQMCNEIQSIKKFMLQNMFV